MTGDKNKENDWIRRSSMKYDDNPSNWLALVFGTDTRSHVFTIGLFFVFILKGGQLSIEF